MTKFIDGTHCHWTYTVGNYTSFLRWPTREAVESTIKHDPEVIIHQVHEAEKCYCKTPIND